MNKKGAEWIGYILATGLFVAISVMAILWAKGHTEESTASTITYMEGKEECKMVFIDAKKNPDCNTISIENKGTVSIEKFVIRADDARSTETEGVLPTPEPIAIDLSSISPTKNIEILPIVEISQGQLASCTAKKLVIQCA
ncbi:MAG: hypothetical protein PHO02_06420 [Candidatus Nanoarchaeia archaeon]|nr:hypothetical protein [Candidatus Nanoarchaeia archaeon]